VANLRLRPVTYPGRNDHGDAFSMSAVKASRSESNLLRPVVEQRRLLAPLPLKNRVFIEILLWHIHCGGIGVCLRRLHEMSRSADEESKDKR
jgi:hypothetical protein